MELGSATQKIHVRVSDVLTGDNVEEGAPKLSPPFS